MEFVLIAGLWLDGSAWDAVAQPTSTRSCWRQSMPDRTRWRGSR